MPHMCIPTPVKDIFSFTISMSLLCCIYKLLLSLINMFGLSMAQTCRKSYSNLFDAHRLLYLKKSGFAFPHDVSRHVMTFHKKRFVIPGHNGSAMRRLPDVLIIGAKKCGTRALLEFLRVHPSVRAAGPEVHFFDRFYHRGLSWYRSQLPPRLEGQVTVEKTPAYLVAPGVPQRVAKHLPDVRLLLVVRDPVSRALSDYAQSLSKHGGTHKKSFEDLAFVNVTTGLVNSDWGPISGGLYVRHLQRWLDYFPRTSFHIIDGEQLVHDPATELAQIYFQEFLGLRRIISDRHFYFNATKGFPCLVKRERTGRPHCLGSSKGRPHHELNEATLQTLKDFYRPFNFKFYRMVGQKFHW
ncbi:unnamed protein product, partial [Meganyctiphanes norvegica]